MLHLGKDRTSGSGIFVPASSLRKHVAIMGKTGFGKTVAMKVFLEESILSGIPSVVIDPHGDLSEFARPFLPELGFDETVDPERAALFHQTAEIRIWTPVRSSGLPLCLNPFIPPSMDSNEERLTASWELMSSGFTGIAGFDPQKPEGKEVNAYIGNLLKYSNLMDMLPTDFFELANMVESPELVRKGSKESAMEFEKRTASLVTKTTREKLARRFRAQQTGVNHLLFTLGTPLDFDTMCTPCEDGRVPLNVIYMNALGSDALKQNFMLEFGRRLFDWTLRQQVEKDEVRLIFAVDEVKTFIPPHPYNPPSKSMLSRLASEGRKFGLCCIFATQMPKSVDYKVLGQASTVCIGHFTQENNINAVKNLLSEGKRDHSSLVSELSKLKPGQFQLVSPAIFDEPQQLDVRWLYSRHGEEIMSEEDIEKITSDKLRACVQSASISKKLSIPEYSPDSIEPQENEVKSDETEEVNEEEIVDVASGDEAVDVVETKATAEFEMNLIGGFSMLKDRKDPLVVMLGITNILTTLVLLWSSYHIAIHAMNTESGTFLAFVSIFISLFSAGVLMSEILADGELAMIQKIKVRARPLQYFSFLWLWTIWFFIQSGQIDLPDLLKPLEIVQTMMTAFIILELSHRIQIGAMDWPDGGTVAIWVKDGLNSFSTMIRETELNSLRASSKELLSNFRLVMDGIMILTLVNLVLATDLFKYFSSNGWLIRVLSIYALLFSSQILVRYRSLNS
tara:strand:+ start:21481 stop:23688 length:2208 start_codon:yes stop_codon:yes gene_type:complete